MKTKRHSICVDFDGTIVEHDFPKIGKPMPHAFEVMKELQEAGYRLILWTCREDESPTKKFLSDAVDFCEVNGIKFEAVNETIPDDEFRPEGKRRKPYCHYFIDDRNLEGFPGWEKVREILLTGDE